MRHGFNHAFEQSGIRGRAMGAGSLTNLHFLDQPANDARDAMQGMMAAGHMTRLLHLAMLTRGVMSASRLMYCTSTAMIEADVDAAVTALNESLAVLRPYIKKERPELLIP
ncbi:uncharacterized protein METZ01_LOCUS325704 [marine metagenome]|uniref:Uncharacterized protein n=1 Tax=marine metagenome TaxID=408172 RepID=A0A382PJ97_9ZZZZ